MYTDHITYQALRQPDAIAVSLSSRDISYAAFDADIDKFAHHLERLIAPRGRLVAVRIAQPYLHWLVVLALGRLGHVSASTTDVQHTALLAPDMVLTDGVMENEPFPFFELSPGWVRATRASPAPPRPLARAATNAAARIAMSSGTTGKPKKMLFSHDLVVRRIRNGPLAQAMQHNRKVYCGIGLGSFSGFGIPLRTWWYGGTMCFFKLSAEALVSHRVSALLLSPGQLLSFVQVLPADFKSRANLRITVGGSALTRRLSRETRERLSPQLIAGYGSNETGTIAVCPASFQDKEPGVAGLIAPGVSVEIVDPQGRVVPAGETGEVRVRSDEMIGGYLDDEQATRRAFRNGWFYPGDLGSLSKSGALKVLGRIDEVMNFGGLKLAPDVVELALASCLGVEDVAAFSMTNEWGTEQPWIAIVKTKEFDVREAQRVLHATVPKAAYRVIYVARIPRNEMGKIERFQLKEMAGKSLKHRRENSRVTGYHA